MKTGIRMTLVAALVLAAGTAVSADVTANNSAPTDELLRMYDGSQVELDQGRVRAFYGAPMTPGVTPAAAAQMFLQLHGNAFQAGPLDLREVWSSDLGNGRHAVFAYEQYINGMPVEHGDARIVVLKGPLNRVVLASGTLCPAPAGGEFPAMTVDAAQAVAIVKGFKQYGRLPVFTAPQLVVYQGEGAWTEPVRTWKFVAEEPNINRREKWTFFIDAATGSLIHVRNEIIPIDVTGNVKGKATPGVNPDEASNPPTLQPLTSMRVNLDIGGSSYTDANGDFTLLNSGTTAVGVSALVGISSGAGKWASVDDVSGTPELSFSGQATPGTPLNIIFNNTPGGANSLTTAQVNAFLHTTKIHDFLRSRSGSWDLIDVSLRVNVNLNDTCNAFWDGTSTNFFKAGGGCVNTAYSDVVSHEYGHFVVQTLGLGQGGFGEGFSDCAALLNYDSGPILGRNFSGPGTNVRNVQTANIMYPCSASCQGESHCCGQLLGYVWWNIRTKMGTFYGSSVGLAKTQQMFVDWMQVTIGGTGGGFANSANPTTAIEILTINDDDGYFGNGTPDYPRICQTFASRNITCPAAPPLGFSFPNGLPTLIQPNTPQTIDVTVLEMSRLPQANSGKISYRLNGTGSYTTVSMATIGTNQYRATIPAQPCNTNIDYYFTATAAAVVTPPSPAVDQFSPFDAPSTTHYVGVANELITNWSDDFETERGWSGVAIDDTATTGRWTRNVPQGTPAQPAADVSALGTKCWVTDHRAGIQISDYDVDDGKTTLTSPAINVNGLVSPRASFWIWYSNDIGLTSPNTNVFQIEASGDDGVSWVPVKLLGPTGERAHGHWVKYGFQIADYVPLSSTFRVRFIASDYTGSIVEAAVDDFAITSLGCTAACYANCDGSTAAPVLNINDFICFQAKFAAGDSYANCDGSTSVPTLNINDFICFQAKFAAGCP